MRMKNSIEPTDKFNSLLVEYINTFNLLEGNVGSCITTLADSSREYSYKLLAKTSCEKKIENLYKIVQSKDTLKNTRNLKELEEWCENAHKMRYQRNHYMHGVWSYLQHHDRVELYLAPWFREKFEGSTKMTLQEFADIVQGIKDCFQQLMAIRQKNGF